MADAAPLTAAVNEGIFVKRTASESKESLPRIFGMRDIGAVWVPEADDGT